MISICIPAYKRPEYVKRLLDSISIQTFRDFEVIITDDSPGEEIRELCEAHRWPFFISYFKNDPPLGTPENWNEAIRRASRDWIKIMHDDDWFSDENSLGYFARAIEEHPESTFVFSAYANIHLQDGRVEDFFIRPDRYKWLIRNPMALLAQNSIGAPSVVLHKNLPEWRYDNRLKWLVDIDFYVRALEGSQPVYIDRVLVNVGQSDQQVTRESFGRGFIEIPENFYLLNKWGPGVLRHIWIYDAWWRLLRNMDVRRQADVRAAGYSGPIPAAILSMLRWQRLRPRFLLKNGFFSKIFMFLCYLFNYHKIEK